MTPTNVLTLELVRRSPRPDPYPTVRPLIDGKPVLEEWNDVLGEPFVVGSWLAGPRLRAAVEHLCGDGPPVEADGRAPLLVCSECHDARCGTLSAYVVRHGDRVHWLDVRRTLGEPVHPEPFDHYGPSFVFEHVVLRRTLEAAVHAVYGIALRELAPKHSDEGLPAWGGTWPYEGGAPPRWPRHLPEAVRARHEGPSRST